MAKRQTKKVHTSAEPDPDAAALEAEIKQQTEANEEAAQANKPVSSADVRSQGVPDTPPDPVTMGDMPEPPAPKGGTPIEGVEMAEALDGITGVPRFVVKLADNTKIGGAPGFSCIHADEEKGTSGVVVISTRNASVITRDELDTALEFGAEHYGLETDDFEIRKAAPPKPKPAPVSSANVRGMAASGKVIDRGGTRSDFSR